MGVPYYIVCSDCGKKKTRDSFHGCSASPTRKQSKCKLCEKGRYTKQVENTHKELSPLTKYLDELWIITS